MTDQAVEAADWLRDELALELPDASMMERIAVASTLLGLLIGETVEAPTAKAMVIAASSTVARAAELAVARRRALDTCRGSA